MTRRPPPPTRGDMIGWIKRRRQSLVSRLGHVANRPDLLARAQRDLTIADAVIDLLEGASA